MEVSEFPIKSHARRSRRLHNVVPPIESDIDHDNSEFLEEIAQVSTPPILVTETPPPPAPKKKKEKKEQVTVLSSAAPTGVVSTPVLLPDEPLIFPNTKPKKIRVKVEGEERKEKKKRTTTDPITAPKSKKVKISSQEEEPKKKEVKKKKKTVVKPKKKEREPSQLKQESNTYLLSRAEVRNMFRSHFFDKNKPKVAADTYEIVAALYDGYLKTLVDASNDIRKAAGYISLRKEHVETASKILGIPDYRENEDGGFESRALEVLAIKETGVYN